MRNLGYLRAVSVTCLLISASAALAQDAPSWSGIPDARTLIINRVSKLPNGYGVEFVNVEATNFNVVSGINIRNGNYAVTYQMADRSFDLTYNSKSSHKGYFGVGWGSPFETRLVRMRDGTIFLQTNGTGAIITISSASGASKYADMMDDVIIKEASRSPAGSQAKVHARLQNDRQYAIDMALQYNALGAFPTDLGVFEFREIGSGRFPVPSCERGGMLTISQQGYMLACGDVLYRFNQHGLLRRGYNEQMGAFDLFYDENSKMVTATNGSKDLQFVWGAKGIEKIVVKKIYEAAETDKADTLTYGARGELTSLYQPKEAFGFKYSYNANLDMTRIDYTDGTSQVMTYDEADRTTSLRNRRGDVTLLRYEDKREACFNYVTSMFKDRYIDNGSAVVFRLEHEVQNGKPCEDTALEIIPG
ncbi:MAG: hypothetical protein RLZZ136_1379 [Pseudomonadota bacterium]